jgi:hypothetical protein
MLYSCIQRQIVIYCCNNNKTGTNWPPHAASTSVHPWNKQLQRKLLNTYWGERWETNVPKHVIYRGSGQCDIQGALLLGKSPDAHWIRGWVSPRAARDKFWEQMNPLSLLGFKLEWKVFQSKATEKNESNILCPICIFHKSHLSDINKRNVLFQPYTKKNWLLYITKLISVS